MRRREANGGSVDGSETLCQLTRESGCDAVMGDGFPRLAAAERRLDDALARLETAVASGRLRGRADDDTGGAGAELDGRELSEALAEVRRQNDELKALSRDAASRLDEAIAQIDTLLED